AASAKVYLVPTSGEAAASDGCRSLRPEAVADSVAADVPDEHTLVFGVPGSPLAEAIGSTRGIAHLRRHEAAPGMGMGEPARGYSNSRPPNRADIYVLLLRHPRSQERNGERR